jgi:glycosyltransferase involved in cell wall biosynthesis
MNQPQEPLIVGIVARNERENLAGLLPKLQGWADRIVLLDTGSTDETVSLAESCGAEVHHAEWHNDFAEAKNTLLSRLPDGWVLLLDADEIPTDGLRDEIRRTIAAPDGYDGFVMPRLNFLMGQPLRHGAGYPDYQLKLFRKSKTRFLPPRVHPKVVVEGPVGRLSQDLEHHPYPTFAEYLRKFDRYTTWWAEEQYAAGRRTGFWSALRWLWLRPCRRFLRRYLLKGGFLDGRAGLLMGVFDAVACIVQYVKLEQMQHGNS